MYCKYCGAELEKDSTLCASCGKENEEVPTKKPKKKKGLLITLSVIAGLVLVLALVAMVDYGINGSFKLYDRLFGEVTVQYKDNYTVTEEKVQKKLDKEVATLGENTLTNEQLQVFYWMQIYNYGYYYDCDFEKPLHEQFIDKEKGMTYQQYFLDTALTSWHQYQVLTKLAKEANYQMPEDYQEQLDKLRENAEKNALDSGFSSLEEMLKADFGAGVSFECYQNYFDLYYLGNLYFGEIVDNLEITDAELEAYYEANKTKLKTKWGAEITKESGKLVDVRHILIQPQGSWDQDEDGYPLYTISAWEECQKAAQKIYDEFLAGEATEETFSALAVKNSSDSNKNDGGLYTDISKGIMVEAFNDWCFDENRKTGDHGLVKTPFGYHIMYFVDAEEGWIRLCRDGVTGQKADVLLDNILEENPMDVNFKAVVLGDVDISAE